MVVFVIFVDVAVAVVVVVVDVVVMVECFYGQGVVAGAVCCCR